jgi:hypothetical protein
MEKMKIIRKAIVAVVGLAVTVGVLDSGIAQDVAAILTAVAVYLVPNA